MASLLGKLGQLGIKKGSSVQPKEGSLSPLPFSQLSACPGAK